MSTILSPNHHILYREAHPHQVIQLWISSGTGSISAKSTGGFRFDQNINHQWHNNNKRAKGDLRAYGFWPETFKPTSMEMEAIRDSEHLDQILEQAQQLSQPILIDWMAAWCRKCIYLKPKLEKLAAEYDTELKFYYVDVNKVPQALVKRGNISAQNAYNSDLERWRNESRSDWRAQGMACHRRSQRDDPTLCLNHF